MIASTICLLAALAGPPLKLPPRLTEFSPGSNLLMHVAGVVTKIDANKSLTIRLERDVKEVEYPLHYHLAEGRHQPKAPPGDSYHIAQIRVGDNVTLGTHKEGKVTYCVEMQICQRLGDLVPPSPVGDPDHPRAYHNWRNQDNARRAAGLPPPVRANPFDLLPPDIKAKVLANLAKQPPPREPPTNIVPPPRKIDK